MSNIKLVLADLHGTVVPLESKIANREVDETLRKVQQKGVKISTVRGQPYWLAGELMKSVGLVDPCIFDGGGAIADPISGDILWHRELPASTSRKVVDVLQDCAHIAEYGAGVIEAGEIDAKSINWPTFSVWAKVPADQTPELIDELSSLHGVSATTNSGPLCEELLEEVQVTHCDADIDGALTQLQRMLDVEPEETLAIGDGENDLYLFEHAGLKIAMGNADDILKAEADEVVSGLEDNGFVEAMNRFVI